MGDYDPVEYFKEHPERWAIAVGSAGLAALLFARKTIKAHGLIRKVWNLGLLAIQVGVIVGLVKVRQQENDWASDL